MWAPSSRAVSAFWSVTVAIVVASLVIPSGSVSASGPSGLVQGFITVAGSSTPIPGALVQVTASDLPWTFEATADGSGYFAIALSNSLYTIQVTSPAYYLNSTSLRVGSGQVVWINMSLDPAGSRSVLLEGFVTDSSTSAPVTAGRIVVAPPYWAYGSLYANSSGMDASGHYAMNLTPGTYELSTDGVAGYAPYDYGYLYLSAGPVRWFNISLTAAPLVSWINGTVENAYNYTPIAGATVTAWVNGERIAATSSNATGFYSVRVPVATVQLVGDALGYAPDDVNEYVYWAGAFSANLYLIPLWSGVRGYVRDGLTGAGLSGVLVSPTPIFSGGYYDQALTTPTGYFAVPLPNDDYSISVSLTGYTSWYSYAFLYSGGPIWVNVTLWPLVATVRGYLTDGTTGLPVPSYSVYGYDSRAGYSTYAVTDATGLFTLTLPPSPAITLSVYGYPPYVGAVAYLATRPYATAWANLTLPRASAQLRAHVTDALSGLPISGATVSASWQTGGGYASTNATGDASVAVASGLPLTVGGWATGYFSWYGTMDAVTTSAAITIQLFPTQTANVTVQGYVRDGTTNASITFASAEATGYGSLTPYGYTDGTGFYQLSTVTYPQTVRVTASGYSAGVALINPTPGQTIWLNFSLATDNVDPAILDFTATPSTNLGPSNPTSLVGQVNESNFARASLYLYMLRSSSAGIGTFLSLGALPSRDISTTSPSPGNATVSTSWDTRTPTVLLSDGISADWWPANPIYSPYIVALSGYWDNATLASATPGTAYFDARTGNLLYVSTSFGYITAADQPTSTFQPYALGLHIDLTTAAVGSTLFVTGSTFVLGSFHLTYSSVVPGGQYAAVLETWDAAGNYANAAALLQVTADTTPPAARAGPDQTVNQGALATLDGTASTDETGVVNYTWTFTDAGSRTLYGAIATYRFQTPGSRVVTLTVRDAASNVASDPVTVTVLDTMAPTVAITSPAESANVSGSVTITTTVSDNVGVVRVEFFADGVSLGSVTAAPFRKALNTATLTNGAHVLTAVAYDAAGNSATATSHITAYNTGGAGNGGALGLDITVWLILILVLVAATVGVLLVLIRRRRPRALVAMPPSPPPLG